MEQGRDFVPRADYASGIELFKRFVHANGSYWPHQGSASDEHRQQRKLRERLEIAAESFGGDRDSAVESVISTALARARNNRPPPIYVMGLGGSGSHWLAKMIAFAVPNATYLTEVYIPDRLSAEMSALSDNEQGFVIDCVHIAHTLPRDRDGLFSARFVNPAAGNQSTVRKEWDPECFIIRLIRDPREQVMSVAFRKQAYREEQSPGMPDEDYLTDRARVNAKDYSNWRDSPTQPDFTCRYEDLKSSAADVLKQLATALGKHVDPEAIRRAAREHDGRLMRKNLTRRKGNLSPEEPSGWREDASERQRAILHTHLVEVISDEQYPLDDCLGASMAIELNPDVRRLNFGDVKGIGIVFTRDGKGKDAEWNRLGDASGTLIVPAATITKLRVSETASEEAIAALIDHLPPDGVESLCLAGNRSLSDRLLETVAKSLPNLRELDVSRTAVTDGAVASIRCLPLLTGLSALETRLANQALAEVPATHIVSN